MQNTQLSELLKLSLAERILLVEGLWDSIAAETEKKSLTSEEIEILDDVSGYQIPLGAAAQVAILTKHWEHVALLRRILLRMRSWQNYIFFEGH